MSHKPRTVQVEVLEAAYGKHSRKRRNHSKGLGALGSFVGNPEMARYSRSALFSGNAIEVIARFSIAGGDPEVTDADRSTRGLGLQFRLPDGVLHHITMLNTPMFFAAIPRTFNEKTAALIPDRHTGKPDPQRFRAYLDAHPENAGQATYLKRHNPPPSYAETAYFGIHTFRFIDGEDRITKVKFRFVPRDGEHSLSDEQMQSAPRDFLEAAYAERLTKGPTQWDMIVAIGEADDEERDPTVLWPTDRKEVHAGVLSIHAITPSEKAGSFKINFDPLMMADGIEPSDGPVLLFRSPSYALSHARRLQEVVS